MNLPLLVIFVTSAAMARCDCDRDSRPDAPGTTSTTSTPTTSAPAPPAIEVLTPISDSSPSPSHFETITTPDPNGFTTKEFRIGTSTDFQFIATDFHFETGLSATLIGSDRRVVRVSNFDRYGPARYRTDSVLRLDQLAQIRQTLIEVDFPELPARCTDRRIVDGTTRSFALRSNGKRKVTSTYQCDLDGISRLMAVVEAAVNHSDVVRSAPLRDEEAGILLARMRDAGIRGI